jgi:hypothetical protein
MPDEAQPEPIPLHEFVERELGFRNAMAKLQRSAVFSRGGMRLVPRPESWLRAEEIGTPECLVRASKAFQGRVQSKLREVAASTKWLFTGWCSATRSVVTLTAADFENEPVQISLDQVGRVRSVKVAARRPSRDELVVTAIEQICAFGSPGCAGWRKEDIERKVEERLGRLGKTQFSRCWPDAKIDERYRKGGKPLATKPTQTE